MLQLGFQDMVFRGRIRPRYEKLVRENHDEEKVAARPRPPPRSSASARIRSRCSWVKKMNGGLKGLRLSPRRSRKLIALKALPVMAVVMLASKIIRMYADDLCSPNFIFSTQWGLPLSSHYPYSLKCKRSTNVKC